MSNNLMYLMNASVALPPAGFPADKGEVWLMKSSGEMLKCKGIADTERWSHWPAVTPERTVWLHTVTSEFDSTTFLLADLDEYTFFRLLITLDKVGGTRALELIQKADFAAVKAMSMPELEKFAGKVTAARLAEVLQKKTDAPPPKPKHPHLEDAVKAVSALGNKVTDARAWVTFVCSQPGSESLDLQEIIKRALKKPTK